MNSIETSRIPYHARAVTCRLLEEICICRFYRGRIKLIDIVCGWRMQLPSSQEHMQQYTSKRE